MYKILLVEDDPMIAKLIAEHLEKWEYRVNVATDFKNIMQTFLEFDPHLVLLDISLPFFNGYYWCNEIRKISEIPIIFISSTGEDMNIITAMDMGADDFIVKPFDLKVMVAKVNALLRRTYAFGGQIENLAHNDVILNVENATVLFQGYEADLTKNEFKILKVLLENKGKIISRNDLMVSLWETDSFIDDNTLTVNVARLRKKLESMGIQDFIQTKKGLGYVVD